MEFNEYQSSAEEADIRRAQRQTSDVGFYLHGLTGEVGSLTAEYKKLLRDGPSHARFSDRVVEELGDVLWYLSSIASHLDIGLNDVAKTNLNKIKARWIDDGLGEREPFDTDFPTRERFPRQFSILFELQEHDGRTVAAMTWDGDKLGDHLTDNAYEEDDYRFHDVFHIAHAAVLGWSPVLRSLMKRKRKSVPKVDEVEDGGRAIAIEEGVTALIFDYLEDNDFLATTQRVDYELLNQVTGITAKLEVRARSIRDWERAIQTGATVWRNLTRAGGGWVDVDLDKRTVIFRPAA